MDQSALKQALIDKRDELTRRATAIEQDLHQQRNADSSEQAQERENDEVLYALLDEARQELALITSAFNRMDNGDYGYCVNCGAIINEKRLEAYPEADKCIHCAA